jgi:hypothetical protein
VVVVAVVVVAVLAVVYYDALERFLDSQLGHVIVPLVAKRDPRSNSIGW